MEAIILAGGLGTRLRSVIPDLPKPLAPIEGKPFLEYLLNYWEAQGIKHFILSVGYKHNTIQEYFGTKYKSADVSYAVEPEPLGTGGGLLLSVQKLKSNQPFISLNGDTFFAVNRRSLLKYHLEYKADMTLSLVEVSEKNNRFDEIQQDKEGWITSIGTTLDNQKKPLVNGGVYIISPGLLKMNKDKIPIKFSLEGELLPKLFKNKKKIAGFLSKTTFIDIGLPQDYKRAAKVLSQHCTTF
jgi:D-glycero-alpha-D-manno-heptose 1-phosphate guanylyltransferase